jgi:2-(1,2-epoxy-1,2-dihydrophenyl)acetyl-CoA isomerase
VIVTSDADGVAAILLDRPDARNAISVAQMRAVVDAIGVANARGARAIVLGTTGAVFSAGGDLGLIKAALAGDTAAVLGELVDAVNDAVLALRRSAAPTIAAIEGPAVGAGMALALAADFRVVGRSARLYPGFMGIGATPDSGGSYLLERALGPARALSFIVRNRPIDADTIVAWGLAEGAVEDGTTIAAATSLAGELGDVPAEALVALRGLLDAASTNSLVDQLAAEKATIATMWPTANFTEGVRAFLERRSPQFNQR